MTRQVRLTAEQYDEWQEKVQAQKLRGRVSPVSSSGERHHKGVNVGEPRTKDAMRNQSTEVQGNVKSGDRTSQATNSQSFFVPGRLPGANDIIRKHHMVYSKLKSEWGLTIARCIIVANLKRMGYCRIEFVWHEANNRRDDDNVIFAQKFVLDALRDTQIIQDDRRQFIYSLTHRVVVDKERSGVQVTLIPVVVNVT